MRHSVIAVVVLGASIVVAGCAREAEPAPAATPIAATEPATEVAADTRATQEQTPPAGVAALDTKALAGTFTAPGLEARLLADGTYTLRVRAESAGADLDTGGTWTAEPDGRHVLLDPHSKSEADRRYEVVSMDELRAGDGQVLRRATAAG